MKSINLIEIILNNINKWGYLKTSQYNNHYFYAQYK